MAKYTPVQDHRGHPKTILLGPFGIHHAKMSCAKCKVFVKWLSKKDIKTLEPGKYEFCSM
jgi:hypothetical protein